MTCEELEMKRIEELKLDKNEEIEKKRNIKLFKYVQGVSKKPQH